jgi:hypothetical protein
LKDSTMRALMVTAFLIGLGSVAAYRLAAKRRQFDRQIGQA